jgi:hypothetical protein
MMGTLDWTERKLIVTTSRTKRSTDFIAHLQALDRLYGPKPGMPIKPVVIVLDNGPIHVSKATLVALAERAHWLTIEWLPKYAPELNDIVALSSTAGARPLRSAGYVGISQAVRRAKNFLTKPPRRFFSDLNRSQIASPVCLRQTGPPQLHIWRGAHED